MHICAHMQMWLRVHTREQGHEHAHSANGASAGKRLAARLVPARGLLVAAWLVTRSSASSSAKEGECACVHWTAIHAAQWSKGHSLVMGSSP